MIPDVFMRLGIALGLGLLVGLQRERAASQLGGIRTFPLITLSGSICAMLGMTMGPWAIGGGFFALAAVLAVANWIKLHDEPADPGQTTEVAAILMFALGAYIMMGDKAVAVALGATTAVLLHLKAPLHQFVNRLGETDTHAIMQFALISLVILPVLPNQYFGPGTFQVLNPRKIWLMVVLIVGIGLAGYVAYKFLGKNAGTLLGGILGGLISSTATTVSYSRRTRDNQGGAPLAAIVIMIASTVAFARVLVEIFAVAPGVFGKLAPPLLAMFAWMVLLALGSYWFGHTEQAHLPQQGNPAQLGSALVFAGLYAVVLLAVAMAGRYFGQGGMYVVGVVSGLTDMDAITLSTAQLAGSGSVDHATGWRVILLASLSNLGFKGAMVAGLANGMLTRRVMVLFALAIAGGAGILLAWPKGWVW